MQERQLEFWDESEWKEITSRWPRAVSMGFATRLRVVQQGGFPPSRDKPLRGFDVSLREMWHRDGQRIVYTVDYCALTNRVYVLDAFDKDSRAGRKMRTSDKERIKARVKMLKREMDQLKTSTGIYVRNNHH